jgi:hypothetical protein
MPAHEPAGVLGGFWQREESSINVGDTAGTVELNSAT